MSQTPSAQTLAFASPDDGEELARAEVYGLLAALFYAPPGEALHAQFQVAVTEAPVAGAFLEESWQSLVAAARRVAPEAVQREFDLLFQGIGKPEIFLYGSFYLAGKLNERPLVELRHSLRALGLEKSETVNETEDHIASLCEVMRYLIAGDDAQTSNLAVQRTLLRRPPARLDRDPVRGHRGASRRRFLPRAGRLRARLLRGRSAGLRSSRRVRSRRRSILRTVARRCGARVLPDVTAR